jgi:colanic acid biosynthesis glycosyl transferase WcaI
MRGHNTGSRETAMPVFLVTQHYRPDDTSTAVFLTAIAEEMARDNEVVVISGTSRSVFQGNPAVTEIPVWATPKAALVRRSLAMLWVCTAAFALVLKRANRSTPVFVVTTPFLLPYFTVLAAWLRGAPSALIVYDLYPDALIASGITAADSWIAGAIRLINRWLFRTLDAVVIIGRDMEKHVAHYSYGATDKIHYIPHWSTLQPHERPIEPANPFRAGLAGKFIVGLSGNLGFTHDPETVFSAARQLAGDPSVHFLLSGWGVGWKRLQAAQQGARLPNVTMVERVSEADLDAFLAAADAWIIPYRRNMSGISVPSRLYNLLAIGRPVIALAESDAEHALMIGEHDAGWVVEPEDAAALARTIADAARHPNEVAAKRGNAVKILANRFTRDAAGVAYRALARQMTASRDRSSSR